MRRVIQIGPTLLLLIAAVATMLLEVWEYRRGADVCQLWYTRSVKKRDIVDNARNALAALSDAEVRAQDYVLTGETVYSEAYANDIRAWQDEDGALELVAKNDPATSLAQDLSTAGTRTLDELALVVSLYEKSGRDAALERIRKSSAIVYLDQARDAVKQIQTADGGAMDGNSELILRSLLFLARLAEGAAALFLMAIAGTLLSIFKIRRVVAKG